MKSAATGHWGCVWSTGSCQESNLEHLHGQAEAPWSTEPDVYSVQQPQDQRQTDLVCLFVCLFAKLRIHYLKAQFSANAYDREYFSVTDKVSANIIEWFKSEGKVSDSMVYAPSVFANLEPSKVWLWGPILPCACCTSGRALTLFLGKVSLGSSTVRASTVPEGSSPVE